MNIAVMGVGVSGAFPTSGGLSYREMIKRAATMAYEDAGVVAEQVEAAVSVEEDFVSGYSIADEYVPDQLGMVRKPVYTICGEFLQGLGSAVMQMKAGLHKRVIVESYCKASNILTKDELLHFAYDPTYNRLGVTPHFLAGIEMQHFLARSGWDAADVAEYAAAARRQALLNPLAPYGARLEGLDVLRARPVAAPLTELMFPRHADACVCVVLGTEDVVDSADEPVWITGTGWGSGTSIIERRDHAESVGTRLAAEMAYGEAGIQYPGAQADVVYLSDLYAHRALMHLDALGLGPDAIPFTNPDGGSLGTGDLIETNGGMRLFDAVRQLRGIAGQHQIPGAERAIVHGWRGLPTDTAAVVVLENDEGRF